MDIVRKIHSMTMMKPIDKVVKLAGGEEHYY